MTWVAPLLTAQAQGYLSPVEVWDVVLACADERHPAAVVAHCLTGLGLAAPAVLAAAPVESASVPARHETNDEPIVILD